MWEEGENRDETLCRKQEKMEPEKRNEKKRRKDERKGDSRETPSSCRRNEILTDFIVG